MLSFYVSNKLELVRFRVDKTAEIDTGYGFKVVNLIAAKLCFKWAIKENPELAEAMGEAGATVYIHQLAGFKVSSTATEVKAAPAPIEPELAKPKLTTEHLDLLRSALSSVSAPLVDGVLVNEVQKYYPHLASAANALHSLLAANNPIPELLLTPTAIGKRLGLKAQQVNQLLLDHGYQVKNTLKSSNTEPDYLPTEKGKPFSNNALATGTGKNNSSYQHLKWQESIIDELRALTA